MNKNNPLYASQQTNKNEEGLREDNAKMMNRKERRQYLAELKKETTNIKLSQKRKYKTRKRKSR